MSNPMDHVPAEQLKILRCMYGNVLKYQSTGDTKYKKHSMAFWNKIDRYDDSVQQAIVDHFNSTMHAPKPKAAVTKHEQKHVDIASTLSKRGELTWTSARYITLLICGTRCVCCGRDDNVTVDHIKPKSIYPDLATDLRNLQVMCEECNQGKGNWDMTDWRTEEQKFKAIHIMNFPDAIRHYCNVVKENV